MCNCTSENPIRVRGESVIGPRFARTRWCPGTTLHRYFHYHVEPGHGGGDQTRGCADIDTRNTPMKIALLVLLGLVLGALGGAALGIGTGLAWVELFKTTSFEGYSGTLVFFTFMPLGAAIGGLGGALLFGVIAVRDAEIAIELEPARRRDR
jgi:hypothetical protein